MSEPLAPGAGLSGARLAYRPEEAAKAVGVGRTTIFEEIRADPFRAMGAGRAC
ncbi:MAG: hypothetical protein JNK67_01895 [Alphaproteobacteria bacterium]|nr:hypothetical protein [Alphaproteobacteria bacterium]